MKRVLITALLAVWSLVICFGQESDKRWLNVNYADDDKQYHLLDIYLPDIERPSYKAVIAIYGSAWFGNDLKQHAFNTYGKALLESGFAVIAINHRSSVDAVYPAQIQDVKAAIRFVKMGRASCRERV